MKLNRDRKGFALPTVIITSIVMMIVLLSALAAASSVEASLRRNYYDRVSRNAAESGAEYAAKCLLTGSYVDSVTISPNRNCDGSSNGRSQFILDTDDIKSTFSFTISTIDARTKIATIVGQVQFYGSGGLISSRTINSELKQRFSLEQDVDGIRATQRWWYFGAGAVFDFKTSGTTKTIGSSSTYAGEGSTTVTDKSGNLLFWSNGITVWDKTGSVMQNGSDLKGASSATQAVAAFPLDDQYRRFGVVSNNAVTEGIGLGELSYSIIDMNGNSGRGSVVTKNLPMGGTGYAHEGLGAMPSSRAGEFWVYAYRWSSSNMIITRFLVGDNGVKQGPLTSTITPGRPACSDSSLGFGTFTFSQDYSKMLLYAGLSKCDNYNAGRAYILDTDIDNGAPTLRASWITSSGEIGSGYSADFSPSEKYVYVTQLYPGKLLRYNIESLNSTTIKNTEWVKSGYLTTLAPYPNPNTSQPHRFGGQIRRGPDGKMYIADMAYYWGKLNGGLPSSTTCYMSVINAPDAPSTVNIDLRLSGSSGSIALPPNVCSTFGLPQMATVYEPKIILY